MWKNGYDLYVVILIFYGSYSICREQFRSMDGKFGSMVCEFDVYSSLGFAMSGFAFLPNTISKVMFDV